MFEDPGQSLAGRTSYSKLGGYAAFIPSDEIRPNYFDSASMATMVAAENATCISY